MREYERAAKDLLNWYDAAKRRLPWRSEPTPYRVWISEIMLQQTRVDAVLPYFERFMERFPDCAALAEAPEEELNRVWQGLGYYSRARNLKRAAQIVLERFSGRLPDDADELMKLPGIGEYTAGAIASIAYQRPCPAVDGNVSRVIMRLAGLTGNAADARAGVKRIAMDMLPKERAGDFNQALMELGALVCLPNGAPRCESCPWERFCEAHLLGREQDFPEPRKREPRKVEERTVIVVCDGARVLIKKRERSGLLAGLWEYVNVSGWFDADEAGELLEEMGLTVSRIAALKPSKHIFTHREWHMRGFSAYVPPAPPPGDYLWADAATFDKAAFPSAFRAYRSDALECLEQGMKVRSTQ
ncbi:MAG: A/G-specific adenine glycosylase [Bacillota bacterium]